MIISASIKDEYFQSAFQYVSQLLATTNYDVDVTAIIKKKNDSEIINHKKINDRSMSLKNILRKLWRKIKKD